MSEVVAFVVALAAPCLAAWVLVSDMAWIVLLAGVLLAGAILYAPDAPGLFLEPAADPRPQSGETTR